MATLGELYANIRDLCKQWFYTKDEITSYLNNKISKSSTVGLVKNDGSIDTTNYSTFDGNYYSLSNKPSIPTKTSDLTNDGDGTNVFVKNNDSRLSDARTPTSHAHGFIENDGTIHSGVTNANFSTSNRPLVRDNSGGTIRPGFVPTYFIRGSTAFSNIGNTANASQNDINSAIDSKIGTINTSLSGKASSSHTHSSVDVTESSALSNIGTSANATQSDINSSIDTIIGNLTGLQAYEVTSNKGTASATTMGKLYIEVGQNSTDVYYTVNDNGTYSWESLDTDILDNLSIDWSDIQNKPTLFSGSYNDLSNKPYSFPPSDHSHGFITSDGRIGSVGGDIIVTDTNGVVTSAHAINSTKVVDSNAHNNIGTIAQAKQGVINTAIDTSIGTINTALGNKANTSDLGAVALSNSYDDLDDLPSIPIVDTVLNSSSDNAIANSIVAVALNNRASSTHNHNYILNNGTITQTVTNNGKLVVTNSSNQVGVESAIDVLDGIVNDLIDYGDS